ncbi:MAG TPA: hypothetical protein PLH95_07845 [Thauera aminoaromatica]|jgi:hypothetical protein|nr:hypothetical protein [Thauera aminoaromatica]
MLNAARWRAEQKGLPFDLTKQWVLDRISRCEVTGLALSMEPMPGSRQNPFGPSLDRKDCAKGYTTENTRVVAWGLNCALSDFGEEAFRKIALAYVRAAGLT